MIVTGGAGFIGSHVVDALVRLRADVTVIDDLSVGERPNLRQAEERGAHVVVGDVRDHALLERELRGASVVIHMACDNLRASLANPERSHDVNATGSLRVARAAVEADIDRLVYVSSSEAYGSAVRVPMDEEHPLRPTTVYGAAKAAGELYSQACMRAYDLPVTVIRPFNSYGPRSHVSGTSAEVIPKFTSRILAGLRPVIFGSGSQMRDFTWVEETAQGIVSAAASDELVGEAVNIAYGHGVTVREICELLLEILNSELEPEMAEPRPGDVDRHYADTTKARTILGFEPKIGIRDGLERYARWVEANGQAELAPAEAVRNW